MKKLMILGASQLQVPAILKAKEMGIEVAVVDKNEEAPGVKLASKFYHKSTIDEEGVLESAINFKTDGIMTLATDMPMRSVAFTAEKMGLPGISYMSSILATDKYKMIRQFEKEGVSHPWYQLVTEQTDKNELNIFEYPCISKPIDSSGSRGVRVNYSKEELLDNIKVAQEYSLSKQVIIEEYLKGVEVSVEAFVLEDKINIIQITDKVTTGAPHFVEIGHIQPSTLSESDLKKIKRLTKKAIRALQIDRGPVHAEIILTNNGPKVIEVGARLGGDNISTHLIPLSTGIDIVSETIKYSIGDSVNLEQKLSRGAAIKFFAQSSGILKSINIEEVLFSNNSIKEIHFNKKIGEDIDNIQNSSSRLGYVICDGLTAKNAIDNCEYVTNNIDIVIEKE